MSRVVGRLAALGLTLPSPAAPVGAYVPAVRQGQLVFSSGQLPVVGGVLQGVGKVGEGPGLVDPAAAKDLARQCALNALAALSSVIDLDDVVQVVKVVGFVAADPSFTAIPAVMNGASELFAAAFGDAGIHARSAVGVAVLPMDSPVEVEVVVAVAG